HGCADQRAGQQPAHDPLIADDFVLEKRSHDGAEHAGGGQHHAAPGGVRMAEPLEAEYEKDRGDEVGDFDRVEAHFFFASSLVSFLRNILSMRSVIMNPPTTLAVARITAINPSQAVK